MSLRQARMSGFEAFGIVGCRHATTDTAMNGRLSAIPRKGKAFSGGADVDWQEYRVIDGRAPGLILNDEEILWLREAWAAATSGR